VQCGSTILVDVADPVCPLVTTPGLPLRIGDLGPSVRDLHRRLSTMDHTDPGDLDVYDACTVSCVRSFQSRRGIVVDGICGPQTWATLIEAGHQLGDRMIYLRSPMYRGDDVMQLQQQLGALGFDAGWVDGIFGPDTEAALRDFQQNQGLTPDGILGRDTVTCLAHLRGRISGSKTVAEVRETESLRTESGIVDGRRLVIGESGGIPAVVDGLARRLRVDGAQVLALHHPDLSGQARSANRWEGGVYIGLTLATEDLSVAYFATDGFESAGGHSLASRCAARLGLLLETDLPAAGLRLPILRETRMPAIWCRLGSPSLVVERSASIVTALRVVVSEWCADPLREF